MHWAASALWLYFWFQLHHTGIKTCNYNRQNDAGWKFQLHHTGIKTRKTRQLRGEAGLFQLHHTGIKTCIGLHRRCGCTFDFNCTIQELKHILIGIWKALFFYFNCTIQELKLGGNRKRGANGRYFNCTIQELKRHTHVVSLPSYWNFNCTIQELKRICVGVFRLIVLEFQLHHTGIKTYSDPDGDT